MPNPTVSSIVASIVAAFDSGMDVFKRLQSERKESKLRRASKKNTRDREDEEEQHLCRSLQRGPSDIMTEYERNTRRFGERFERGDGKPVHFSVFVLPPACKIGRTDERNDCRASSNILSAYPTCFERGVDENHIFIYVYVT